MNERELKNSLQELVEQETADGVDLWPAVEARLQRRHPVPFLLRLAPRLAGVVALVAVMALFLSWLVALRPRAAPVESDPAAILDRIRALTERQRERLFARQGWLHIETRHTMPGREGSPWLDAFSGESGIYPSEQYRRDRWYRLDEGGRYSAAFSLTFDENDDLAQQSLFSDGKWTNLTLRAAAEGLGEGRTPLEHQVPLPGVLALRDLEFLLRDGSEATVTLEGLEQDGQYAVTALQTLRAPLPEPAPGISETVDAARTRLVYEATSGQLLRQDVHYRTVGGEWLLVSQLEVLTVGAVDALPDGVEHMLDTALQELAAEDAAREPGLPAVRSGQEGITVTIQDVAYREDTTTIALQTVVGAPWAFDLEDEPSPPFDPGLTPPPTSVMATRISLQDGQGREIAARSSRGGPGGPERDPAAGTLTLNLTLTFDAVAPDSRDFTLTIYLELHEPPADRPLRIDWESGQRVSSEPLSIAGVPLTISATERIGADTIRITAPVTTRDGATLSCVHLYPPPGSTQSDSRGCYRAGDAMTSDLTLAPASGSEAQPASVLALEVRGTISFEAPWMFSWDREQEAN